ncbi:MAG TPA: OmpH family outer membrane protein [Sphingobacteriaceae bacterium]|nr:OmpH family outer membrane protein [Sphingobacteriaceae bacterium]
MKNLLRSFAIVALIMSAGTAMAQQKIGHINSGVLLQSMPEVKTADATFETFRVTKLNELEAMEKERQAKIVTYQDKYKTLSEANKEVLGQELENLGQEIQTMSERIGEMDQKAQEELAQKREELYQPILAKAEAAVQAVAKAEGFSYVFDTANQALVFFEGGIDITPSVKTKLGIQ